MNETDPTMEFDCTCCTEPRPICRFDNNKWAHTNNKTHTKVRHLHTESSSSDYNGRYSQAHTTRLNSGIAPWALRPSRAMVGRENDEPTWSDLVNYCFKQTAGIWGGRTSIEIDTDEGYMRWNTVTDEGGSSGQVRVCDDPWCAYDDDEQRDYRAESMGY